MPTPIYFKIVVPSFNCPEWMEICLKMIEDQTYPAKDVCVIDDVSTLKGQREIIEEYCQRNQWKKIFNSTNLGALHNIVKGIAALECQEEDVILLVDGDDCLYNSQVLETLAKIYQEPIYLTYGNYISYPPSFIGNPIVLSEEIICKKQYRDLPYLFTHLRTFKYALWRHLKDEDLRDDNKEYFRVSWDAAIMWPLLEMAGHKFQTVSEILYVYNISNPLNDFKLMPDEIAEAYEVLRKRPVYPTLDCCK